MKGAICYIIQEGDQLYLCAIDDGAQEPFRFLRIPIDAKGCARLASECAWHVNSALGGYNPPLLSGQPVAQRQV